MASPQRYADGWELWDLRILHLSGASFNHVHISGRSGEDPRAGVELGRTPDHCRGGGVRSIAWQKGPHGERPPVGSLTLRGV